MSLFPKKVEYPFKLIIHYKIIHKKKFTIYFICDYAPITYS